VAGTGSGGNKSGGVKSVAPKSLGHLRADPQNTMFKMLACCFILEQNKTKE